MARAQRPFSRLPLDLAADPRFGEVWGDDAAMGAYLKLLIAAEQAWPSTACIPRSVGDDALTRLVAAGIIERRPAEHFVMVGLDDERAARSESGRKAVEARWHPPRDPSTDTDALRANSVGSTDLIPKAYQSESESESEKVPTGVGDSSGARGVDNRPDHPQRTTTSDPPWSPEWDEVLVAWHGRGRACRKRPTEKQREAMWPAVDARGRDVARLVAELPAGLTANEVVGRVLVYWDDIKSAVPPDPPPPTAERRPTTGWTKAAAVAVDDVDGEAA